MAQLIPITENPPAYNEFREFVRPSPPDRMVSTIRFESAIITEIAENNIVEAELILPRDAIRPVPVVIILHYWGAHDFSIEMRLANELLSRGIGAAFVPLPYHMKRTPPGMISGTYALLPSIEHLKTGITQSVFDVKRLIDYLESRTDVDHTRIGITGISLGGVLSSLVYGVEPRIQVASVMMGGGDFSYLIWHSSITLETRNAFRNNGVTEPILHEQLKSVEPLTYANSDKGDNILIIGARYDEVVPPESVNKLISAYDAKEVVWLSTGHYGGALVERRLFRITSDFMESRFYGRRFLTPESVGAPTIRFGVMYNPDYELTLSIGIDLWKPDKKSPIRLSGWLTPEGPALSLGYFFEKGFSAGFVTTKRKSTWGMFWSFVL